MVRPRFSEEQQQQRELNARRDLEQLIEALMDAAGDICHDLKLSVRDRSLAFGRGATLLATFDRVSKVLLDQPGADVRADRLIDLHDLIEAAGILAGGLKAPVAHRLGAAKARKGVSDKTQPRDKRILELVKDIRFISPKKKRGTVAREVFEDKRLTESVEWKAKPMGLGGVDAVVRKHWPRLSPSLPKRARPR